MTREDIITLAREADVIDFRDADSDPHVAQMVEFLQRFAALMAAAVWIAFVVSAAYLTLTP